MLHSTSELTYDIKLADFGIAKLLNQKSQNQYYARNQSMGTACYMAPEALSVSIKCQLISKCLFGVSNSPKNKLENLKFCPSLLGQKFFVRFLGELKKPKCLFEIN